MGGFGCIIGQGEREELGCGSPIRSMQKVLTHLRIISGCLCEGVAPPAVLTAKVLGSGPVPRDRRSKTDVAKRPLSTLERWIASCSMNGKRTLRCRVFELHECEHCTVGTTSPLRVSSDTGPSEFQKVLGRTDVYNVHWVEKGSAHRHFHHLCHKTYIPPQQV